LKILDAPDVAESAARLRDIMISDPGLQRPTDSVDNRFEEQQRRAAQPGDKE
jgi:hypothetical protein